MASLLISPFHRRKTSSVKSITKHHVDLVVVLLVTFFCLFGVLMIFEASNVSAYRDFGDKYHYVREQLTWFALSFLAMITISFIHYRWYYKLSVVLLFIAMGCLVAVFIPGIGLKLLGAHRWINLGFFTFQPSELMKLVLILYLSSWLSNREKNRLQSFLLLLGMIVGLVVLQPDLGTAVILCLMFLSMYFLSGGELRHFALLIPGMAMIAGLLAVMSPYRMSRIMTYLNPTLDPLGSSYHVRQILISFGSGGLWGVGLGASRQKYQFLPEATTDSIFAIIGEELGFIGAGLLLFFYLFFLFRLFRIAARAPDKFSYLLACGIFVYFSLQTLINLGAMVGLFPLTGVPLPFVSYGGTHLLISMSAVGIAVNISRYTRSDSFRITS